MAPGSGLRLGPWLLNEQLGRLRAPMTSCPTFLFVLWEPEFMKYSLMFLFAFIDIQFFFFGGGGGGKH